MKTNTLTIFAVLFLVGCEVPELEIPRVQPVVQPEAVAVQPVEPVAEEVDPNEPPPVTVVPRPWTAKDPVKGKKSRAAGAVAASIGGARFYAEYENLRINIVHALDLYWGEQGEYPQSHQEFLDKIVKFNNLVLPELDPGVEYIYDPADHILKIYRPDVPGGPPAVAAPAEGAEPQ